MYEYFEFGHQRSQLLTITDVYTQCITSSAIHHMIFVFISLVQ